jgi:hypothetical protein
MSPTPTHPETTKALRRLALKCFALTALPHKDETAYVTAGPAANTGDCLSDAELIITTGFTDGYQPASSAYFTHDPDTGYWELLGWDNDDAFSGPFSLEPIGGSGTVADLRDNCDDPDGFPAPLWSEADLLAHLQDWLKPTGETRKDQLARLLAVRATAAKTR